MRTCSRTCSAGAFAAAVNPTLQVATNIMCGIVVTLNTTRDTGGGAKTATTVEKCAAPHSGSALRTASPRKNSRKHTQPDEWRRSHCSRNVVEYGIFSAPHMHTFQAVFVDQLQLVTSSERCVGG